MTLAQITRLTSVQTKWISKHTQNLDLFSILNTKPGADRFQKTQNSIQNSHTLQDYAIVMRGVLRVTRDDIDNSAFDVLVFVHRQTQSFDSVFFFFYVRKSVQLRQAYTRANDTHTERVRKRRNSHVCYVCVFFLKHSRRAILSDWFEST